MLKRKENARLVAEERDRVRGEGKALEFVKGTDGWKLIEKYLESAMDGSMKLGMSPQIAPDELPKIRGIYNAYEDLFNFIDNTISTGKEIEKQTEQKK